MIDLHSHTDFSDGTFAPAALVQHAAESGITLLAVTDHDTVDSYLPALEEAQRLGIQLLCGVELSTHAEPSERSVHLLGYFSTLPPQSFCNWLRKLQEGRRERNIELLARLRSLGLELTWDEVQRLAQRQVGRPHFAQALVARGYVSSLREAFDRYLGEGAAAWVERDEPPLTETLAALREAEGVSSLAHPVRIANDAEALGEFIAQYATLGLDAVECFHPEISPELSQYLVQTASELGLGITGGSDFHGANKPGIAIGTGKNQSLCVPKAVEEWIIAKLGAVAAKDERCRSSRNEG
ncbi:PHP domain-containing protein [Silvibacterium dinghuense]|uniref:PHP domain-containing protein n=1 Tax=Silvibacterium dinghuense TaxID=1560006 RepID=UPI0013E956A9|nr:PHP domain-containing protein [Silvibacterium dinghuense]GGG90925.1 phosphatase [Silvibacterium dinghuense]